MQRIHCVTAKLLVEFEQAKREKARNNGQLAAAYGYAASEFRKALHLHIAECGDCLSRENDQERAA